VVQTLGHERFSHVHVNNGTQGVKSDNTRM